MDYLQYRTSILLIYSALYAVLNLVINGLPSIPLTQLLQISCIICFKPCYKWITFNTDKRWYTRSDLHCFKPCYKWITFNTQIKLFYLFGTHDCFKPCYKWITFNTKEKMNQYIRKCGVLNLVINGLPSILLIHFPKIPLTSGF